MCGNYKNHFKVIDLAGIGLADYSDCIPCVGAVLQYLYETQKTRLDFLNKLTTYSIDKYMVIDFATRRNLELVETMRDKNKKGSLLWVLDKTKTAMGARRIRYFIEHPLKDISEIRNRQDAIEDFNTSLIDRDELREYLGPIYDLERLLSRISYKSASPRDLIAFRNSLKMLPAVRQILKNYNSTLLKNYYNNLDCLEDLEKLIGASIVEDPPLVIKDGGIIKDGYSEQIDILRKSKTEGKNGLLKLRKKKGN